jgi:hypothetical protein
MRLHLHRERHIGEAGDADEFCGHLAVVDFQKIRHVALGKLGCFEHRRELLGGFLDLDGVADLQLVESRSGFFVSTRKLSGMERATGCVAKSHDNDLVFADPIIDQIGIGICWEAPDIRTAGGTSGIRSFP